MSRPKVWLITGASRGFGRRWTEAALARGDKVAATARDLKSLEILQQQYGDALLPLALDITDHDKVVRTVNHAHQHFGRLDVILSVAGYGYMGAIEEVSIQEARANFETNVFGTLSVIQAALPLLRAQGSGHILPVSSAGGIVAFPTGGYQICRRGSRRGTRRRSCWLWDQGNDHRAGAIRDGFHERIVYQTGDANAGLRVRTAAPDIVADRGGLRRSFRNRRSDSEGGRCVRPAPSSYSRQCNAAVDQTGLRGAPEDLGKLGQCLEGRARQQAGVTS